MNKLIVILSICLFAFAGEYGMIKGKIVDSHTGGPAARAKVILEETELSVETDENGEYILPHVRAGTYSITVTYPHRESITYLEVVINADQIRYLNFIIPPFLGYISPIRVVKLPLITVSRTSSGRTYIRKDIERLPGATINDFIKIQPGVTQY
jgi:hypothetical protein